MNYDIVMQFFELTGTIAFASSGALTAINKKMDLFGIITISIITAVGGGVFRDLLIGNTPVNAISDPLSIIVSSIVALVVFVVLYLCRKKIKYIRLLKIYEKLMFIFDTIGLGIFTVTGITVAINYIENQNSYTLIFAGVITAVGGGVVRDIIVNRRPEIFLTNIYASASIVGAVSFVLAYKVFDITICSVICLSVVVLLRILSVIFKWNLPKLL
ncbi:MAG: trimeric intracellular cation channel family protein [Clostridia bacterium]